MGAQRFVPQNYSWIDNESTEEILFNRKQEVLKAISQAFSDDQILIRATPKKEHRGPRSSKYRGVSLNGKKYQTLVMGFRKKAYRGRHNTEVEAAIDYDRNAILSQGLNVGSNSFRVNLILILYRQRRTLVTRLHSSKQ